MQEVKRLGFAIFCFKFPFPFCSYCHTVHHAHQVWEEIVATPYKETHVEIERCNVLALWIQDLIEAWINHILKGQMYQILLPPSPSSKS